MNLHKEPFEMIENGSKTFELRLYDEKRQQIRQDDEIFFTNTADNSKTIRTKVVALHLFTDFASLYAALPLDKCGYLPQEIPSASPDDMNVYYSPDEQVKYGVVGIEIELI